MDRFEKRRTKLDNAIEKFGLNSKEVMKESMKMDRLINSYYKNEKQYHYNNLMHKRFIESKDELKKLTIEFERFPSISEWDTYAKDKELLSSESIKYISGLNWHELRNVIVFESGICY